MKKRGQIALFVIIAVFLVGAFVLIYTQKDKIKVQYLGADVRPISSHVESCIEKTALDGVYLLGLQGGFIMPQNMSVETKVSSIAYGYYRGRRLFPFIRDVEKDLSNYMNMMLPSCVDWKKFPDFRISGGKVAADMRIYDDYIDSRVEWPLTVEKGKAKYTLESFQKKTEARLGKAHKAAEGIINRTIKNPNAIDISYLIELDENEGFKTDLFPSNDTLVYSITDPKFLIGNRSYVFFVATKS